MSLSGLGQGGATEPCLGLASPSSTPGPPLPAQLPERQGSLCVRRSACPSVSPSLSLTRTWGPRDPDGSAWARPGSGAAGGAGTCYSHGLLLQVLQVRLQGVVGGRAGLQVRLDLCQLLLGKVKVSRVGETFPNGHEGSWCPYGGSSNCPRAGMAWFSPLRSPGHSAFGPTVRPRGPGRGEGPTLQVRRLEARMVFPGSLKERNLLASSPPHTVGHPRPSTPSALGLCWRAARADRHAGSRGDSLRLSPDRVQVCRLGCDPAAPSCSAEGRRLLLARRQVTGLILRRSLCSRSFRISGPLPWWAGKVTSRGPRPSSSTSSASSAEPGG